MKSILIADDDLSFLHALQDIFREEGFLVYVSGDGTSALEQYRSYKPDLVLLDYDMPGKDGYEVMREIRKKDRLTIIMMMTGNRTSEDDAVDVFDGGAVHFVRKPIGLKELRSQVRAALRIGFGHHEIYSFEGFEFDVSERKLINMGKEYLLSDREVELLYLFLKRKNTRVEWGDILFTLWKNRDQANKPTAMNLISSLKKKLDKSASVAIISEYGKGYRLEVDEKSVK